VLIEAFDFSPCVMPKKDPAWRFALGARPLTEAMIVKLVAGGVTGYGYAAAAPHMGSTMASLATDLARFRDNVLGREHDAIAAIMDSLEHKLPGSAQARAGVDCALHDLLARILDVPLTTLFGGAVRHSFPVLRILAIKTPEEMAANALRLTEQGVRYLKLKIEGNADLDVARVGAVRKAVGDHIHLTVDANQSYTATDAVAAINRMAAFGIDLVEQPVPAGDHEGLALVSRQSEVLVEADEAAASLADIYHLVSRRLCGAVSLKLPKLGGLRNVLAAARLCEAGGMRYRFGAAVGSRLLTAHALHLAASLPGISYACEFGEFDRLLDDPFEGLETRQGTIDLPDGPGTGLRPAARAGRQQAGAA